MKKGTFLILSVIVLLSCGTRKPFGFTNYFTNEYTGIDTLINIDGYFFVEEKCRNDFYCMFMFYPNGLFTLATTSTMSSYLRDCFKQGGDYNICKYPSWGTYEINNDTIITQLIVDYGPGGWGKVMVFRDYLILPSKELLYISEYCIDKDVVTCNEAPANPCPKVAQFVPMERKRSIQDCPWLKKGWFNKTEKTR